MKLCEDGGVFDLNNACVRASWSALTPAGLVVLLCVGLLPLPRPVVRSLELVGTPFQSFLTVQESEALYADSAEPAVANDNMVEDFRPPLTSPAPFWRISVLVIVGILETVFRVGHGAYQFSRDRTDLWSGVLSILLAISWLYTVIRPIARHPVTAPYDLCLIYLLFFAAAILQLGGALYDHAVAGLPLPSTLAFITILGNLFAIVFVLTIVLNISRAIPSSKIDPKEIGKTISPEDYSTIWQWLSFSWIYPLIKKGRETTLHEKDVWDLGPTLRSRPLFVKFNSIRRSTLLRRIWATNSQNLILDFIFSMISILFNYANPFFLKRILDATDQKNPTPESRANAYIYAFLAFLCSLLKAQADAQHLWFGRRASIRIRSELMASIYDKALKRKDFSGTVNKDKGKDGANDLQGKGKNGRKGKDKGDASDSKGDADIGKIVNLMSIDSNRIARVVSNMFNMYSAPVEIAVACVFLYQLLGLNAFAGFVVLIVFWPLNNYLGRRAVRIHKGVMAANDKRMGVLNELIGAIKFIKYFAWEERWIDKALEARQAELKWIVQARFNAIMLGFMSSIAPIFVSVLTFTVYVLNGNQLTISTAFTAIALFSMVRAPLRVLPQWFVQILQAGVAVERIAIYLEEEEVTEQVSSLKKNYSGPRLETSEAEGFGLENATLKWNEVKRKPIRDGKDKVKQVSSSSNAEARAPIASLDNSDSVSARTVRELGERPAFELKDVSVRFPLGKMTLVTGPTASGKSALLMAVLGEMTLLSGRILLSKDPLRVDENGLMNCISYAAQHPWLRHESIKDNILFGYPYNEERYNAVVECCALIPDLEMLEDGDATEIGARGVNLSGGQKARVALARAVYARTKYVLLDDPLSAVDSHTARVLFDRLLCGPLLADRTVVLVTHHVELVLPGAHYLVRMLDGRIDTQGSVADLKAEGLMEGIEHDVVSDDEGERQFESEIDAVEKVAEAQTGPVNKTKKPRKLIKDEHRETGGVKWSIYRSYLKASSYWIWAILACVVVINQFLGLAEKLWVRAWGEAYRSDTAGISQLYLSLSYNGGQLPLGRHPRTSHTIDSYTTRPILPTTPSALNFVWPNAAEHPFFYIGIYAAICFTGALVTLLSVASQYTGALRASRILFRRLLISIVRATFRFHDTTPTGRILNRFGKDIETIDSTLASSLQAVNTSMAGFLVAILTVALIFPYFVIPAFFIGLAYRELAIGYLNTGRDLRRMESTTRSPIYSHFGELLEGIVTVRAFSAERRFLDGLHAKIDVTTKMWYMFWMTNRWLLLNFDSLGAIIVLLTMIFSISTLKDDAGLAAVCITSAMSFTFSVYWTCRYWTTLELDLNSVERVVEYLEVPQEPPAIIESNRVPAYWPSGSNTQKLLVVEDLQVKYAPELPAVLNDVSFALKAGERVGLLGRTGSGKSTLATSIMRFVEPSNGRIIIDGIDISKIGLYDLRSRLTFIPQDATLFSGTLRDNLDPFSEHSDAECLGVLYRVHLIADEPESISASQMAETSDPESLQTVDQRDSVSITTTTVDARVSISLESQVSAGGTNFSQGQRQLIAMARALLRRSTIIILDEATSSIDFATDAKIQATIREEFTSSLLLTVAHRLRTIIDYDRLIVLDKGSIVELDTPWNLIQKENGFFRTMCLKSGTFSELENAAKGAALKRHSDSTWFH